jgi:hypothetical protein
MTTWTGTEHVEVWEAGGGLTSTGRAVVFCGELGDRLVPRFVRVGGELACREHARFVLPPVAWRISVSSRRGEPELIEIARCENGMLDEPSFRWAEGDWQKRVGKNWVQEKPPAFFFAAVAAAVEKSRCWHCRAPHYASSSRDKQCHRAGTEQVRPQDVSWGF